MTNIVGRKNHFNAENKIAEALYKGLCYIDNCKDRDNVGKRNILINSAAIIISYAFAVPYVRDRYFAPSESKLPSLTKKFNSKATSVAVALDAHEVKLHSKFAADGNSNRHRQLTNSLEGIYQVKPEHELPKLLIIPFSSGVITAPDGQLYHLQFEVRAFAGEQPIEHCLYEENIRTWFYVSSADLQNVNVCEMEDEEGTFFISDTANYVPKWLRNGDNVNATDVNISDGEINHSSPGDNARPETIDNAENNSAARNQIEDTDTVSAK